MQKNLEGLQGVGQSVPFPVKGYDSDSGGEFVNWHLVRYFEAHGIQPTRSRPYKTPTEERTMRTVAHLLGGTIVGRETPETRRPAPALQAVS